MPAAVHIFNPENDLALAADLDHYTPPRAAVELRRAGELLPLFWAEEGDTVLVELLPNKRADSEHLAACREWAARVRPGVTVARGCQADCRPEPWGWSRDIATRFRRAGVAEDLLPSEWQLAGWRALSHRRLTVALHERLGLEAPAECHSVGEALEAVAATDGRAMIKMPWSCSGRGVFPTVGLDEHHLTQRLEACLRRQPSVMVEPLRDKQSDFAALYRAADDGVAFQGLSLFSTDGLGAYSGNILLPDSEIIDRLGVDPMPWARRLSAILTDLVGDYRGWLGVDMLTYRSASGELAIEPCVEVNLRRTMGVVAHHLRQQGHRGIMNVTPGPVPPGAVPLLPPTPTFSFSISPL